MPKYLRRWPLGRLTLALLLFFLLTAVAAAQNRNLCQYLPQGYEPDPGTLVMPPDMEKGITDVCVVQYPGFWMDVARYKDVDTAKAEYQKHAGADKITWVGDEGYQVIVNLLDADNRSHMEIAFRRNCYIFDAWAGRMEDGAYVSNLADSVVEKMGETAGSVDIELENLKDCPGMAASAPAAALGVKVGCQYNYPDPGQVVCTAQPQNAAPDAALAYAWDFDGQRQAATGAQMQLTGVKPGAHVAAVVAQDGKNGLASQPASVNFTKAAAAGGTGTGSGTTGSGGAPSGSTEPGTTGGGETVARKPGNSGTSTGAGAPGAGSTGAGASNTSGSAGTTGGGSTAGGSTGGGAAARPNSGHTARPRRENRAGAPGIRPRQHLLRDRDRRAC